MNLLGSLFRIAIGVFTGFGLVLSVAVNAPLGFLFFLVAGLIFLQGVRR
jgi:TctA family transporter